MPLFGSHTPESLLNRADSKNPATTCKGLTSNGRPCRRSIAAAGNAQNGVLAVSSIDDDGDSAAAAFYCWQHKDQAEGLVDDSATPSKKTKLVPLQERTSLDTLVERLGVLELDPTPGTVDPEPAQRRKHRSKTYNRQGESAHHVPRPPTWSSVQSPVIEVPVDALESEFSRPRPHHRREHASRPGKQRPKKEPHFWSMLCFGTPDDDYVEVVRHKRRHRPAPPPEMEEAIQDRHEQKQSRLRPEMDHTETQNMKQAKKPHNKEEMPTSSKPARHRVYRDEDVSSYSPKDTTPSRLSPHSAAGQKPSRKAMADKAARPINSRAPSSETNRLLSLIPHTHSPQTTSALLAELSKPISTTDEPGYIYIFWLTPESQSSPSAETTASLLSPGRSPQQQPRKNSNTLLGSLPGVREADGQSTILLKIGRARNVHRRMAQWESQCGYTPSLLRFYPHVSSPLQSPATTPDATPRRPSLSPETSEYLRRMSETHARASKGSLSVPQQQQQQQARGSAGFSERRPSLSPENSVSVRQVPNVKRVERLVQLELADKRVKRECDACGRVHMEWFEVEASRDGVKVVDEVVRRWVEWSENNRGEK